jgi:hypothetical protein
MIFSGQLSVFSKSGETGWGSSLLVVRFIDSKRLAKGSPTLAKSARMGHPRASDRIEG